MVKNEECAWITKSGYCRWHKEMCCRNAPGACEACVRPHSARKCCLEKLYMQSLKLDNNGKSACLHPNASRGSRYGYKEYRTCGRKRRFTELHSATKKAIEISRAKGISLAVYECPFCHGYHLTKQCRKTLAFTTIRSKVAA